MATHRPGRHAPAFLLLLLSERPSYGLELLSRLDAMVPDHRMDSAIVYRTLGKLHQDGLVTSALDDSAPGPAKKIYTITHSGRHALEQHARDIEQCVGNLQIFLRAHAQRTARAEGDT